MRRATGSLAATFSPQVERYLLDEVLEGLHKYPKELAPKWLYDEAGSQLFDMICELPEYYLTRAELEIMNLHASEIAKEIGPRAAIIEFGSGTSAKTRLLLDHLDTPAVYIPVDIAQVHLLEAAAGIARDYPDLAVVPLRADFTKPLALPTLAKSSSRRVVYFPGSTLGNFEPLAACSILQSMGELAGPTGKILIGIDLKKEVAVMERAYSDAAGITSRFNLNALRHVNRTIGSDFPLSAFEHHAVWVAESNRIEMRLLCKRDLNVHVGPEVVEMQAGEYIHTESCHKYTNESFACLAATVGLQVQKRWVDPKKQFSVQLLEPMSESRSREHSRFAEELAEFRASLQYLNAPAKH